MTRRITPEQFHAADAVADWRVVFAGACACFVTESYAAGFAFVEAVGTVADEAAQHLDLDLRGGWNNSAGYHKTVSALSDVGVDDSVCSSGGYTGVHCLLTVTNLSVWFTDVPGQPAIQTISARTTNTALIAGGAGDSGGPIMIPNVDGVHVWAVGILQEAPPSLVIRGSACDKYARDPGYGCSRTVLFTSERVFLHYMHATLRTG